MNGRHEFLTGREYWMLVLIFGIAGETRCFRSQSVRELSLQPSASCVTLDRCVKALERLSDL